MITYIYMDGIEYKHSNTDDAFKFWATVLRNREEILADCEVNNG